MPLLSIECSSPIALGVALFVFGASLGSLDVAMNLHAVEVERVSEKPLMSGFHALFSVGAFLGSGMSVTALLSRGIALISSTIFSSIILVCLIVVAIRACSRIERERNSLSLQSREVSCSSSLSSRQSHSWLRGLCSTGVRFCWSANTSSLLPTEGWDTCSSPSR